MSYDHAQSKATSASSPSNASIAGDHRPVGKGTLVELTYGNGSHMLASRHPSYAPLIAALEAIKSAADDGAAEQAVAQYTANFGSRYRDDDSADNKRSEDWQYNVLENFNRAVQGDRQSLEHLKQNLTWIPKVSAQQILALAITLAPRKRAKSGKEQAQAEMVRLLNRHSEISNETTAAVKALLATAGFKPYAISHAHELLFQYWDFHRSSGQGVTALVTKLDTCIASIELAAQQGTVSLAGYAQLHKMWLKWRSEYNVATLTPDQRDQKFVAHNRVDNAGVMHEGERALEEAKRLRAWVDQKHGFTGTGWGDGYVMKRIIGDLEDTGGALGGEGRVLEEALALPDTEYDKAEKVRDAYLPVRRHLDNIRMKGVDVVTSQDAKRETGYKVLGYAKIGSAYIPGIGKPLSVALAGVESFTRYESGDWGAAHALANVLTTAVEAKYGEAIVGEGSFAARALRKFGYTLVSELSLELSKILGDKPLTAEQREEEIRKAVMDCLVKAFLGAIAEIGKATIKSEDAHEIVSEAAKRLGILHDQRIVNALSLLQ